MSGPDRTPYFVECGPNTEAAHPTPYLEWQNGVLMQWHEARCEDAGHVGVVYTTGVWRPVPQR